MHMVRETLPALELPLKFKFNFADLAPDDQRHFILSAYVRRQSEVACLATDVRQYTIFWHTLYANGSKQKIMMAKTNVSTKFN